MAINSFNYENITKEEIKKILESAFMVFGVDDDGDIYLKDSPRVYIQLSESKKRLTFFCLFNATEIEMQEKTSLVNEINIKNYFPKVMVMSSGNIRFDYDLEITTEITTLYFVTNLRNFSKKVVSIVANPEYSTLFA
ncbi:YbjN domain-containing protein [Lonsdalea populi]|uniref:YbjN domain-containing protein n=1 Tax=Lonsdalea populi TaxID=1172565 RepID=A0A3N0UA21_9GAMM|nr:YbjN domain-containing protein [Lonsdalea populi]ROH77420.1 YbjN domain-containing protein [Lonsdalea populi]ROH79242.1 YbjN domain-containing protein [Lonsdalea populi]